MTTTICYAVTPVLLLGVLPVALLVLRDRLTGRRGVTAGEASDVPLWVLLLDPLAWLVVPPVGFVIGVLLA